MVELVRLPDGAREPVLMALHAEYYDLIWQRLKAHEFRRRFLEGRAVRWFVYLNAPVSRLAAEQWQAELGAFHPPQGNVRLAQHPELMAVCEKVAAQVPIRSITVHHRLYRFRCGRQRPGMLCEVGQTQA